MASMRLASNVSIRPLESKFDEMIDENTSYYIDTNSFSAVDFDRFINSLEESYTVHHRSEVKATERQSETCAEDDDDEYGVYHSLSGYARTEQVSSYGGTPSTVSSANSSVESLLQLNAPHNTMLNAERSPIVTRKSFLNIFQYFDQDVTLDRDLLEEDSSLDEARSNRVSRYSLVELMEEKLEPRRGFASKKSNKLVLREWDTNVERVKEVRPPTGRVSEQRRVGRLNEQLLKVFESEETPCANNSLVRGWRTNGGKANATAPEKVSIVQHHHNPIGQPKKLAKSAEKRQNRDADGKKTDRSVVANASAPVSNVAADARQQVNHADSRKAKIVNAAPKIQQVLSKPAPNQRNLKDTSGTVPERDKCYVRNINDLFLQYRSRERTENGTFSDFNQHVREAIEEIEKIEENHVRSVLGKHAFEQPPGNTVNESSSPSYVSEPARPSPVEFAAAESDWEPVTIEEPPKLKLEATPEKPAESAVDMHYRLRHDTYRHQMNSLIETDQFVRMSAPDRNRLYLLDTIFNRSHLSLIHTVLALLQENIGKGDRVLLEASINGPVPSATSNRFVDTLAGGCYRIDAMTTSASGENCVELDVLAVDERTGRMLKITVEFVIDVADKLTYVHSRKANNVDEFHFVVRMVFEPPENELQKSHETGTNLSEHQLRVQASLQRLNIPDWYKQYSGKDGPANTTAPVPTAGAPGGILRKRNSDVGRWTGLSSKTTSLSSLGSHRSDRSPVMLSPSAHSHHGQTGFSRWSTSHLNSNQTSPSVSTRGSFTRGGLNASAMSGYSTASTTAGTAGTNSSAGVGGPSTIRNSFRQPYLGWRSQEKLSQPRTPAERCWLESSFVGTRPLDSPQTPMIENSSVLGSSHQKQQHQQQPQTAGDHYRFNAGMNGVGESTLI
uniref:Uncharacterized protein n=1 Tax=Anopheles atroparvus TaxID=41427 RepID=A0A182JH30_ANOAO